VSEIKRTGRPGKRTLAEEQQHPPRHPQGGQVGEQKEQYRWPRYGGERMTILGRAAGP